MSNVGSPTVLEREYEVCTEIMLGSTPVWVIWSVTVYDDGTLPAVTATTAVSPRNFDEVRHEGHSASVSPEYVPEEVYDEIVEHVEDDCSLLWNRPFTEGDDE